MADERKDNFLGFDFSTQQAKAIVINSSYEVLCEESVQFDNDLPEFRTHGGVHVHSDELTVTVPTVMWVKAMDMLMDKLRVAGADFSTIRAISGAGQQHGTIYWRCGTQSLLSSLEYNRFLHDQLATSFSIPDSPIWMDSSTSVQCRALEQNVGGAQNLADITGSRGYERFSGNQIAKLFESRREAFLGTEACAPNLTQLLGDPIASSTVVGHVGNYFIERYGFRDDCEVVAFTGDNPSSLAGMFLNRDDIGFSLGTSDTMFLWLIEPKPQLEGHVFVNPIDENDFMALLCFKNGSLTRKVICDECAEGDWQMFDMLLESTPRGNYGNLGMYYHILEITPSLCGVHRFNKYDQPVVRFASKEVEIRALLEGQFLARRIHAEKLGLKIDASSRILATGGASRNRCILQVLSDVFNAPVYTMEQPNSACLGAAVRAIRAVNTAGTSIDPKTKMQFQLVCSPSKDADEIYTTAALRFEALEKMLLSNHTKS